MVKPCMCVLRSLSPGQLRVRAVLRHCVPYKGLHPLRRLCGYPCPLRIGNNLFAQTVSHPKPKTQYAKKLAQERSRLQRLENRKSYYEKGDRKKRAHRLITRGAAVESIAPLAKALSETEFYAFTEKIFALPEVRTLLMEAVNAHNEASQKGKG